MKLDKNLSIRKMFLPYYVLKMHASIFPQHPHHYDFELSIQCNINSKINGTLKGFYFPISKLHSDLAVANLLALNNITISYYVQINCLRLK